MADFLNDPIGKRYGCSYKYTKGALGTFGKILNKSVYPRKIVDPVDLNGADFVMINAPFEPIIKLGSYIQMCTQYTYPTDKHILLNGTEEITKDEIDFSKFKKVINFTSLGEFTITAIPMDQLFISKNLIDTSHFPDGISHINITATNANVKVALTKDDENWVKYDTETGEWVSVDVGHQDTDTLKSTMMPLATLNSLNDEEYAKYFNGLKYIGIALLISIEPTKVNSETGEETYDTTKSYTVTPISINFIGDDNAATDPITQYFNFVKVGYNTKGNPLLVADRVIQTNIKFNALGTSTSDLYNGTTKAPISTEKYPMYMRLFNGGNSDNDEWDELILNASQDILNGESINDVFNVNLGSMTNIVATSKDIDGAAAGATVILYRGGESNPSRRKNIAYNATNSSYGWRPIVEIDCTSDEATQTYPGPALPEVHSMHELTKGKCISCDIIANYISGSLNSYYFANLGKAKLAPLSDYKNLRSGSFYFICVGYNNSGDKILIADRNIATNFNYNLIFSKIKSDTTYTAFGDLIHIDNPYNDYYLTLPSALHSQDDSNLSEGFWNNVITNEYDRTKTVDQIWHTDKISSLTSSISSTNLDYIILKGKEDMSKHLTRQKAIKVSGGDYSEVGFRPMLIVPNQDFLVKNISVNMKTGYGPNKNQNKFIINCEIVDDMNTPVSYKLVEIDSSDNIVKDLTSYNTTTERTIEVSNITEPTEDNYNFYIGIVINKKNTDTVLFKVPQTIDKDYRLTSTKTFTEYHNGWITKASASTKNKNNAITLESASIKKETVRNSKGTYVSVSKEANRIHFN